MTIAFIVTLALLCLVAGYSARQMQDERQREDTIKERDLEIERLTRENEGLRRDKRDHETNLEMVLGEIDKSK